MIKIRMRLKNICMIFIYRLHMSKYLSIYRSEISNQEILFNNCFSFQVCSNFFCLVFKGNEVVKRA